MIYIDSIPISHQNSKEAHCTTLQLIKHKVITFCIDAKAKYAGDTSVSILNDTKRAMTAAAASWSKPATNSYSTNELAKEQIP